MTATYVDRGRAVDHLAQQIIERSEDFTASAIMTNSIALAEQDRTALREVLRGMRGQFLQHFPRNPLK